MWMKLFLRTVQIGGFIGSQIFNVILLYFIYTKASKLFGKYRHLMAIFSVYAIVYSYVEIATQPIMHVKGYSYIVYMDSFLKYEKWIGNVITTLYCGSFAMCISLLTVQFVYRYIAVCYPARLSLFDGFSIIIPFILPTIFSVMWFLIVLFVLNDTPEKEDFYEDHLRLFYNEDSHRVSFICGLYRNKLPDGTYYWKYDNIIGVLVCTFIMVICFWFITFCAYRTYSTMRKSSHLMSQRTHELNRQLFLTLSLQTLLPLITMYLPVGLFIVLPLFGIETGRLGNVSGVTVGVYPALDPVIAILMIKEFRNAFLGKKILSKRVGISTTYRDSSRS